MKKSTNEQTELAEVATLSTPEMNVRSAPNYGGRKYRTTTITGEPVERFAAPVRFSLDSAGYSIIFEMWEDVSDFENNKISISSQTREFSGKISEKPQFNNFFAAISGGAISFLALSPDDFEMTRIYINALDFNISAAARHKSRINYAVNDSVTGVEGFEEIKNQYLDSVVMPFLATAWALAADDRNLSKFE